MEFGVNFFPAVDPARKSASTYYDESLQLVELAEELGFAHVRTGEHYGSACGGYSPDPVVFLTAAAAQTRRIRLVAGAAVSPFAHPVQIAARLALLDNLSHGRLDAGFAHGGPQSGLFGVPGGDGAAPVEETAEACIALWSGEEVRFEGDVHRFGPVTGFPCPTSARIRRCSSTRRTAPGRVPGRAPGAIICSSPRSRAAAGRRRG